MGKIKLGLLLLLMTLVGTPMTGYGMQLSESELYARSACLMDADSGRVLYSKNSEQKLPMASTTKIMTCILALEDGRMDDLVTVSAYAASQPKVHMGAKTGEQFYLQDLLYALMLNSDNDAAVMIAEQVGGSVEGFAEKMNLKARELGCDDTYFITPNGLDAENKNGIHSTTAKDLARILRYCIMESPKKAEFLDLKRRSDARRAAFTAYIGCQLYRKRHGKRAHKDLHVVPQRSACVASEICGKRRRHRHARAEEQYRGGNAHGDIQIPPYLAQKHCGKGRYKRHPAHFKRIHDLKPEYPAHRGEQPADLADQHHKHDHDAGDRDKRCLLVAPGF